MAATYEFPTDRVHLTWDTGNEPALTISSGDTVQRAPSAGGFTSRG
jgi:hypothetical protein